MLSTLFPPDPTLTADNVSHIMEKVKEELRPQIWEGLSVTIEGIIKAEKYSSERGHEYADHYVNCSLYSSWEHLASTLYRYHQVAAVEEVRSYLPPRGEPYLSVEILQLWQPLPYWQSGEIFLQYAIFNYNLVVDCCSH